MVERRANKHYISKNVSLLVASFVVVVAVLVTATTTSTAPYLFSEAFVCCRTTTIKHRIRIAHRYYYGYEYDRSSSIHAVPFKEFEMEGKQNHTTVAAVMTTGIMPAVISTKQKNNMSISTSVVVAKIVSALAITITTMTLLLSSFPMVASASTTMMTNENDYVNNNNNNNNINNNNNDPVISTTVMISAGAGEKISSPLPNDVDSPAVIVRLDSGVTYRDLKEGEGKGEGEVVTEGKRVNIQWVLKRSNGYSIDSSSNNDGVPFIFIVGGGGGGGNNNKDGRQQQQQRAIAGLDEGIRGMKLGGIRRIVIPPSLAYTDGLNDDGTSPGPVPTGFGPKQRIRRVMENRMDVPDESFLLDVKLTRIQ